MRIGVDLRCLQGHSKYRGIGKYALSTISELVKIDTSNEYVFYIYQNYKNPLEDINLPKNFKYELKKIPESIASHRKYIGLLFNEHDAAEVKDDGLEIFFQPDMSYGLPKGIKSVLTFHDMIPLYYWKKGGPKYNYLLKRIKIATGNKLLRLRYLRSLSAVKRANKIIAISESTKKDLLNRYDSIKPKKVSVIYEGVDDLSTRDLKLKHNYGNYILYVGGVDVRKNIKGLAKIFFEYKEKNDSDIKLVLAGKEFDNKQELNDLGWFEVINKSKYKKDIIYAGYVDDNELNALYKNSKAFVFPSLYEGFGLPVLEAMAMGAPVVAFDNSSIPEVAGDAAILCSNDKEFEAGIEKIVNDSKFRKSLIEKGYKQVHKFSWEKTAKETLKVIEDLGREKG